MHYIIRLLYIAVYHLILKWYFIKMYIKSTTMPYIIHCILANHSSSAVGKRTLLGVAVTIIRRIFVKETTFIQCGWICPAKRHFWMLLLQSLEESRNPIFAKETTCATAAKQFAFLYAAIRMCVKSITMQSSEDSRNPIFAKKQHFSLSC